MSNFAAIIPVSGMESANTILAEQGYGPNNFSIPAFNGANPGFGVLHCWASGPFLDAVLALPGITVSNFAEPPYTAITEVTNDVGAIWAKNALPLTGVVTPGLYYYVDGSMWWVIQQYDTTIWPDPNAPGLQAIVVPARMPGEITTWIQPLNQFTAYFLVNQFTGLPDEVTHNGKTWFVSQGDGAGLNTWEPGVFGWTEKT